MTSSDDSVASSIIASKFLANPRVLLAILSIILLQPSMLVYLNYLMPNSEVSHFMFFSLLLHFYAVLSYMQNLLEVDNDNYFHRITTTTI